MLSKIVLRNTIKNTAHNENGDVLNAKTHKQNLVQSMKNDINNETIKYFEVYCIKPL